MAHARIATVTGGNKGIGYAIIRGLALQYPRSSLNKGPLLLYLTARDKDRGNQAVTDLQQDPELSKAKALIKDGGLVDVKFKELDVEEGKSIEAFVKAMHEDHEGGIDILVNNAGVSLDGFDSNIVRRTLAINYYGAKSLTERFLPHMRKGGRIVTVASMLGKLNKYNAETTAAFQSASTADSTAPTDQLMAQYQDSVDRGAAAEEAWPTSAYSVSKTGIISATSAIAKREKKMSSDRAVCVNTCCPGYVNTDLTKHRGRRTVEQGAMTPVHLALEGIGGVTGEFWEREEVSSW